MARVVLEQLVKMYGRVKAVDHVSLDVQDGEFLALLGPSGCGKTSTMRMIAGLEDISRGSIYIGEKRVNALPPAARNVAMAFENYGLYPHMTLFNNIAYPLKIRGMAPAQAEAEVMRIGRLLHIEKMLGSKPKEVSGGVQQRVSLARALVRKPSVFLLDEPLSHLDAELRGDMRGELKRLHELGGSTTIYVTHDQLEAMTMSDRVAVMHQGVFQQVGTPAEIFFKPANRFVASFIGEPAMNILPGKVERSGEAVQVTVYGNPFVKVSGDLANVLLGAAAGEGGMVQVGVRPPDFQVHSDGAEGLPVVVRVREFTGENLLLTLDTGDTAQKLSARDDRPRVIVPRSTGVEEGAKLVVTPRLDRLHFFVPSTGESLTARPNAE